MKILFNPPIPNGSDIKGLRIEKIGDVEPFLAGEVAQWPDNIAEVLLNTFGFLSILTPEEAKQIKDQKGKPIKCTYEGCDFSTEYQIALAGHTRKHEKEVEDTQLLADPEIVPVKGASGDLNAAIETKVEWDGKISSGKDADGVEWYGDGLVEEKKMAAPVGGQPGIFGGQYAD